MKYPPLRLSLTIWGLAAAIYLFGFFQRVTPAALANDLMRDFELSGAGLGNLSAFYFYAYAAMQIPTGVLVDRLGPTRLLLIGSIAAGAGAVLFALAPQVGVAAAGRALIGAAHGIAWVSMLTLVAHWFAPSRFGTMSGVSLAVGTLGAVLAGPPLRMLADAFGWRDVIAASGGVALMLALGAWRLMRDDPLDRRYMSYAPVSAHAAVMRAARAAGEHGHFMHDLVEILRYRNTWLIFWTNSGVCGAFLAFTGLWGVPFFVQHHALTVSQATGVTSAMLVMFAAGGPAFGALSDRIRRRKLPFVAGSALSAAGFGALALVPDAPLALLVPMLVAAGFGAGSMACSFPFATESVPPRLQGAVTGMVNSGVMVGALTMMPTFGLVLDAHWQGALADGVRLYPLDAFRAGWQMLAGWIAASTALLLLTRETHARVAATPALSAT